MVIYKTKIYLHLLGMNFNHVFIKLLFGQLLKIFQNNNRLIYYFNYLPIIFKIIQKQKIFFLFDRIFN